MRIVDLSLNIYDKAPTFWPDPKTTVIPHLRIENMKYNITQLILSSHLGTHLDAPYHFFDEGRTVDKLDLKKCFGAARVLNFTEKKAKEEITRADLEAYDKALTPGARIIIHTGWDRQFPDDRYFSDCPGITPEGCAYLVERKISCLAMDMPTIYVPDFVTVHHALLRAEILVVEGLAHLNRLENESVLFMALPLKITGRDGSPCRAAAIDGLTSEELQIFA